MRKLLAILLVLATATAMYVGVLSNTHTELDKLPPLESGDIILHTLVDKRMLPTMYSSQSLYNHAGIVSKNIDGYTVISELNDISETSLAFFVGSGWGEKITVLRYTGLTDAQRLLVAQEARYLAHNPRFSLHSNTTGIYCCEFPHVVYNDLNIPIGKEQTITELNINNPLAEHIFHFHSLCSQNDDYESCWDNIMKAPVITPESITQDPKLTIIYSNYPKSPFDG